MRRMSTRRTTDEYFAALGRRGLRRIPGFLVLMLEVDPMHVIHLGIAPIAAGNCLLMLCNNNAWEACVYGDRKPSCLRPSPEPTLISRTGVCLELYTHQNTVGLQLQ